MEELEGSARSVSLRAAACMLAGDMRDPISGARVRRAVDAQLRRAGVEAQDADDVRTEVVLALLGSPAAELPLAARAGLRPRRRDRAQQGRRPRPPPGAPARRARRRAARARRAGHAARIAGRRSRRGRGARPPAARQSRSGAGPGAAGRSAAGRHPRACRGRRCASLRAFRARPTTARSLLLRHVWAASCAGAWPVSRHSAAGRRAGCATSSRTSRRRTPWRSLPRRPWPSPPQSC